MQATTAIVLLGSMTPSRGFEHVANILERVQPERSRLQIDFLRDMYDDLVVPEGYAICQSRVRGVLVQYVQVWKANTQGLCRWLTAIDDNSTTSSIYTFTFVRSPSSKVVSGFSELAYRAAVKARLETVVVPRYTGGCNRTFNALFSPASQARIVVDDLVNGRLTQECYGYDRLHLFPSTSFILAALRNKRVSHINFIGRLERFRDDIGQLALHLGVPIAEGAFDHTYHPGSDANSAFAPRDEMQKLLHIPPSSTRIKRQLCMMFLPDFACLDYALPPECQAVASRAAASQVCSLLCPQLALPAFDVERCERSIAASSLRPQCALQPPWQNVDVIRMAGINPIHAEGTVGLWDFFKSCNRIYETGLNCHNTSVSMVADQLLSSSDTTSSRTAITAALFLRITGCFYEFMRAEHFLAHPIATMALHASYNSSYLNPRPAAIATVVLMYEFVMQAPPFGGIAALYRVEDSGFAWGFSFDEWSECLLVGDVPTVPQAITAVAEKACRDKLLLPGRFLTLTVHLTYSMYPNIWDWRTPEKNGFLRWRISPPHGHAHIVCGMPIAPAFAKDNFQRCGPSGKYDSYDGEDAGMSREEVVLLPGSRLIIEDVQGPRSSPYTTVFARQYI